MEGTKLLDRPDGSKIGHLEDNTRLTVVEEMPGRWYHVLAEDGRAGYVKGQYVSFAPEGDVEASLYRITNDDKAGFFRLMSKRYGPFEERSLMQLELGDWGSDARFYARVVQHVNKKEGRDWVKGPFKKTIMLPGTGGFLGSVGRSKVVEEWTMLKGGRIWLPGKTYADTLHGIVSSGSASYEAKEWVVGAAKALWSIIREIPPFTAGVLVGAGEHLLNMVKDLFEMVWGLVKSIITGNVLRDAKALLKAIWEMVKSPVKVFKAIAEGLKKQWDDGWFSRGKLFGALLVEVVILVLTWGSSALVRAPGWLKKVLDLLKGSKVARYLDDAAAAARAKQGKAVDAVKSRFGQAAKSPDLPNKPPTPKPDAPKPLTKAALKEWAASRLRLSRQTIADLGEDAIRLLRALPDWAMDKLSRLGPWAQRACLGCASPCNVNLDKVIKALAETPATTGKKLVAKQDVLDALPLNMNATKIAKRIGDGSPLRKLIEAAGLTDDQLLQLRRFVVADDVIDSAQAYKTFVRFVTHAAAAKISDINQLRTVLDSLHTGVNLTKANAKLYGAMGRSLKGSVFESWCRTHLAALKGKGFGRQTWKSVPGVKLAKGQRASDLWDAANGAIWDFKHSTRVDPVQSADYVKLLRAPDKVKPPVKEVNYVFPSKDHAVSAGVQPPIKVWYVDKAGAARQLVAVSVP